tara:strand:+ start:3657 stop:4196 length:540 start_codon:yes stop_codon:yes gene_type:complete
MASVMKVGDEVRLNILSALLKQNSVSPNIKQLQKYTGYHKATIKSSLDFLINEGLITGYGPKVDFRKFDYKLEVLVLMQADLTKKEFFKTFLDEIKKDPHLYSLTSLAGSGNYNLVARHIYEDIETFHEAVNKKYFEKLDGIHDFMKRRDIVYVTEPYFKMESRTGAMIKILRESRGYD